MIKNALICIREVLMYAAMQEKLILLLMYLLDILDTCRLSITCECL